MPIRALTTIMTGAFLLFFTIAAPSQTDKPLPDVPPPPPPLERDVTPEPEVTIRREGGEVIEEYRINGRLYMIKVTPSIGPSYYLVDKDGDGKMNSRINGPLDDDFIVPQWVLFSW